MAENFDIKLPIKEELKKNKFKDVQCILAHASYGRTN